MYDILLRFKPDVSFCLHSFVKVREVKLTDICPLGAALMCKGGQTYIQTDRQTDTKGHDEDNRALLEYPKPSKTE